MAAKDDYIPSNDAEFESWMTNFTASLTPALLADFGMDPMEITTMLNGFQMFKTDLAAHVAQRAGARAAVAKKNDSRDTLEDLLRPFVRRINNHPAMTDTLRLELGLNPRDSQARARASAGDEVPGLFLETKPGQVIIHFGTDATNELHNGKPDWAFGCSIYRKKAGESAFSLIAFDTASPYVDSVTGAAVDVTYKVAYRGRGEDEHGPVSPEQTIAAGG
jgi:hypothetical protein